MDASLMDELRGAEPIAAVKALFSRLSDVAKDRANGEPARSEALSQIQHLSEPHVAALLVQFIEPPTGDAKARDSAWRLVSGHLEALTAAMTASAKAMIKEAASTPSGQRPAAAAAARALRAWRLRLKSGLLRYHGAPAGMWHTAYALHRACEVLRCDGLEVQLHGSHRTTTTVTHELLRLAMLQAALPEAITPAQIEVADWAVQQVGGHFLLWPRGAVDAAFYFDPGVDQPPCRAGNASAAPASARHFGPGPAHDALAELAKEIHDPKKVHIKGLRRETAARWQASAIQHLLAAWSDDPPHEEPSLPPAEGGVSVVHGFGQCWQALSQRSGGLRLVDADEEPSLPPESWTLEASSGNQMLASKAADDWMRCGELVVLDPGDGERSIGLIRSLRVDGDLRAHAHISVISHDPKPVDLRPVGPSGEGPGAAPASAREVRAILLADGEAGSKPNLLLPPDKGKPGSAFEWTGTGRLLQLTRHLRLGDDYARMAFEWSEAT